MSTNILEEVNKSIETDSCEVSQKCPDKFSTRSFTKTVLKPGEGFLRPYLESECVLDISCVTNDKNNISDHSESFKKLQIPVGENVKLILGFAETEAVRILEKCVMTMKKGEESKFVLNIFGVCVDTQEGCSSLLVDVVLREFSETKPTWSLDSETKYSLALMHKEKGTDLFKNSQTEAAFCQYSIAVYYLICIPECTSIIDKKIELEVKSKKEMYSPLKCVCYLNLAACQMKAGNHRGVVDNCTHALCLDPGNVKGLYRRAQANILCGRSDEARSDLNQALKIEPKNHTIAALLRSCQQIKTGNV